MALADADPPANPNLSFLLADLAKTMVELREEGKGIYLHCVRTESRTPIVAAAYLMARFGLDQQLALNEALSVLPDANPRPALIQGLRRLAEVLSVSEVD